ncbi:helicase associated domain-containing protein [Streptomyces puniciscabiei]
MDSQLGRLVPELRQGTSSQRRLDLHRTSPQRSHRLRVGGQVQRASSVDHRYAQPPPQDLRQSRISRSSTAAEDEKPQRRTQADKWALNYAAARQYYEREGHLRVPRKHIETIVVDDDGEGQEQRELRLGAWIGNQRSRAATLSPERVEQLSTIGIRWS